MLPCRFIVSLLLFLLASGEEQVTWTANEDAENAPLPLSMKQRQQLMQLEQTIRNSPDPNGTLQQVAQANNMSPQDLVNMMDKNARDLQQNPSLARPVTIPSVIAKAVASLGLVVTQMAKKNPKMFLIAALSLFFVLYAAFIIPRTGIHATKSTTLFAPSQRYLQKLADSPRIEKQPLSIKTKKTKWDDLVLPNEDGVHIHKLPRRAELVQAVSAKFSLEVDTLLEELYPASNSEDEEVDEELVAERRDEILELLFENSASLVASRQFTSLSAEKRSIRTAAASDRQKHGIFLVPGLGAFGRYGLLSWQATRQMESDKDSSVTLTTLKGMRVFDGQIHCEIKKFRSKVLVTAHVVVPRRGKKLRQAMAKKIVDELVQSVGASAIKKTQQTLARQAQGRRFKSGGHRRANERRHTRFEKEKEIEEMSEDRRRRWQRANPDAGRYTPSGDRQRSPNNC